MADSGGFNTIERNTASSRLCIRHWRTVSQWRILVAMVFIESAVFTKQVQELLTDDSYAEFQHYLAQCPEAGDLIRDTGGLRKVRWSVPGRGKSGGVRIIYYHVSAQAQCRMLLIYRKGIKDDLSAPEKQSAPQAERELVGDIP